MKWFSCAITVVFWVATLSCASIKLQGEKYHPVTADGWPLTLEHFPPEAGSVKKKYPVILCHGLLSNRNYFKINEERSLAAVLAKQGYDVWLMDMRGRNDAGAPGYWFGKHTYTFSMDDYIRYDVDAAISEVLQRTGAAKVNWIGHSMGGIVAYSRIGSLGEDRIANLVTIGSPMLVAPLDRSMLTAYRMQGAMVMVPVLPFRPLAHIGTVVPSFLSSPISRILIYEPNTDKGVVDRLMVTSTNNIAKAEIQQFIDAVNHGGLISRDKTLDYRANLRNIKIPVLIIGGRRDHLADPLAVRDVFDRISSRDKTMFIASRAEGLSEDYGHTDLVVGKRVNEEIFPHILKFLGERN